MEQASCDKMFKPITSKLDDVALGNMKLPALQRKRGNKRREVPDYGIAIEDQEIPDYALADLYDEEEIQPEQNKQLAPYGPPKYEETLADKLKRETNLC